MAYYTYTYKVNLDDIGNGNLCTNHAILSYLEDIAAMHSEQVGLGVNNRDETGLTFVLLQWKLAIQQRIPYGTTFTVRTWARQSKKVYCYRDFEILDATGTVIAKASSKWTLIHIRSQSLEKITEEILTPYQPEERGVFPEVEIPKLSEPACLTPTYTFTVPRTYMDVNGHVHNLHYLTLAYEALPASVYEKGEFPHVEILYKREMKQGDTVVCSYCEEDGKHVVSIRSQDGNTLHAIIKLY